MRGLARRTNAGTLIGWAALLIACCWASATRAEVCRDSMQAIGADDWPAQVNRTINTIHTALVGEPQAPATAPLVRLDAQAQIATAIEYTTRCLRERYQEGHSTVVTLYSDSCCDKTEAGEARTHTLSGSYRLSFSGGRIVLSKALLLLYQGLPESEERVRGKVHLVAQVLTELFAQQGVTLDLQTTFVGGHTSRLPLEWASMAFVGDVLTVYDETPRDQVRPWSNQWVFPSWQPDGVVFGIIAHEFSHTIGLPDTYDDAVRCPLRTVLQPDDVVTSCSYALKRTADGQIANFFAADHIRALLAPLCGP